MKLSDRVRIAQQVIARQVGEETVMLDLANGAYFGLNPVGARVWQLLGEDRTLAEICDIMTDEYDVSREDVECDILGLAEELIAGGLIAPFQS
jgi:hypothetical protein